MKTPEDIDRLENLLRNKDFAELTFQERTWVLQHVQSEEAYTALRVTEQQLTHAFAEPIALQPRPEIRSNLRNALKQTKQKPVLSRLWLHPIPTYQVAAGLLLLSGCFLWFQTGNQPIETTQARGFTPLRDTILITQHDTIIQEKQVVITRYKSLPGSDPVTSFRPNFDTTGIPVPPQIKNPSAQGVSMKEDTLLQHFFVREIEQ